LRVFLLDDVFPVANPCSLAEERPVHAFFQRCLKQPPDELHAEQIAAAAQ